MQPTKEIKDSITILDKYTGVEFPLNSYPIRIREICDHLHEVRGTPKEIKLFARALPDAEKSIAPGKLDKLINLLRNMG